MNKINDYLYYFKSIEDPVLSADSFVIKGNNNYLFDAGNNENIITNINELNIKNVFISHFHLDHIGKVGLIKCESVIASKYTLDRIKDDNINKKILTDKVVIDDGVLIEAYIMPSTHSKGALIININKEITLLGDAIYTDHHKYNVSKLGEMIKFLESLNTKYFINSHESKLIDRNILINKLKEIFKKREKNKQFIEVDYE